MTERSDDTLVVNILDKSYTFVTSEDQPAELIWEIAQLVDGQMKQVRSTFNTHSPLQVAILASLNLIDELRQLQDEYQNAASDIEERASKLASSLGRIVQEVNLPSSTSSPT